jgi:hypothetical protein
MAAARSAGKIDVEGLFRIASATYGSYLAIEAKSRTAGKSSDDAQGQCVPLHLKIFEMLFES